MLQYNLNLSTCTTIADKLYFSEHLRPVVDLLREPASDLESSQACQCQWISILSQIGKIGGFGRKGLKRDQYGLKLCFLNEKQLFLSNKMLVKLAIALQEFIIQLNTHTHPTIFDHPQCCTWVYIPLPVPSSLTARQLPPPLTLLHSLLFLH